MRLSARADPPYERGVCCVCSILWPLGLPLSGEAEGLGWDDRSSAYLKGQPKYRAGGDDQVPLRLRE
jgi:hypothetical protein